MSKLKIRFATIEDIQAIVTLCEEHANYEQADYDPNGKEEGLTRDLFSGNPKLFCLVVANENMLLGYATYMKQYATWDAAEYVYMDCLFVMEKYRSQGLGEQLIDQIKKESQRLGCTLIQWQTPSFNTRAMKFYNRIGAFSKTKERFFLNSKT
ncbi:MAG: GNAT family N-acetyltransferase [Cyclobacteriaceae bacterium]|uniref:GNAT family N-acetyltransferase n=1 Tax=Fulvivirga sp. TaxID=1931237 RepID=UPI0032F04BB0